MTSVTSSLNSSVKRSASSIGGAFKSSRLSMGAEAGLESDSIVAVLGNAKVDPPEVSFQAHKVGGRYGTFTINGMGNEDVKFVGTAKSSDFGLEYYLAYVNKRTGKAEKFERTSIVQFEPKFRPAELNMSLDQESEELKSNADDFATRRRNLTAEFGSLKKNKFLDNSFRRQVDENTLAAITPAVFKASMAASGASSTADAIVNVFEEMESNSFGTPSSSKKPVKNEMPDSLNISLLKKATSDVLPTPNHAAQKPADVYSVDLFLPKSVDDNAAGTLYDEAIEFFKKYPTVDDLVGIGVPRLLASRISNVLQLPNAGKRACIACKAIIMAKIVAEFSVKNVRMVDHNRIILLHYPPTIASFTCAEFLSQRKVKDKLRFTLENKFRLHAHLLCLLLLFDGVGYTIPLSKLAEFHIPEISAIRLLRGMGCEIVAATAEEHTMYNSLRMARLLGPPRDKSTPRRGRRSK